MKFIRNDPALRDRRRELRHNQTEAEQAFWIQVRNRQCYEMRFFRQYSCGPYVLDFYCPKVKLAVELDGGQHNEDEKKEYDQARSAYLRAHGIEVLLFWNHEVLGNMEGVMAQLSLIVTPPALPLAQVEENHASPTQ